MKNILTISIIIFSLAAASCSVATEEDYKGRLPGPMNIMDIMIAENQLTDWQREKDSNLRLPVSETGTLSN